MEYKSADALNNTSANKKEISKDVSAMANSAGGVILYGIEEQKGRGPITLDPMDPTKVSVEWAEQVIDSTIKRRISDVRVRRAELNRKRAGTCGRAAYT